MDEKVYNNGRYFVGVGRSFTKFDITWQLIELKNRGHASEYGSLAAWSLDGQSVLLELSFMFQIDRSHVYDLWRKYRTDYRLSLLRIASRTLKEVATKYTTVTFFTERKTIGADMKKTLRERMKEEYVSIEQFNLRSIDLPDNFEYKIEDKVIQAQEYKTAQNEKITAAKRAQLQVIQAEATANVTVILAEAHATELRIVEKAKSSRFEQLRKQEAESYSLLGDATNLNGTHLLNYRFSQLASEVSQTEEGSEEKNVHLYVGFDSPIVGIK